MKRIVPILMTLFLIAFSSCRKDPDPGETAVKSMANEWWVQTSEFPGFNFSFSTYNTASNTRDSIWIDDQESFWQMKGKVKIDLNSLTFSGTDIPNEYYPMTFTIDSGRIIPNGARGPVSKAVTDSIYFTVKFSDDTTNTVYRMTGYARTRFAEDDH